MTIKVWLDQAIKDAERRGLTGLPALLEALARSASTLRSADWNDDATGQYDARHGARSESQYGLSRHESASAPRTDEPARSSDGQ